MFVLPLKGKGERQGEDQRERCQGEGQGQEGRQWARLQHDPVGGAPGLLPLLKGFQQGFLCMHK